MDISFKYFYSTVDTYLQITTRKQAMTFKIGQSGNPAGRRKGSVNKRTELSKLLDPYADKLVNKMIELALNGDVTALRLCIERLIPKIHREPLGIEYHSDKVILKEDILKAVFDGRIRIEDAERLNTLLQESSDNNNLSLSINTTDPVEASKIYQQFMMGK